MAALSIGEKNYKLAPSSHWNSDQSFLNQRKVPIKWSNYFILKEQLDAHPMRPINSLADKYEHVLP